MRMVGAELLKMRRRSATYVVLGVLLVIMALLYLVIGANREAAAFVVRFPGAWTAIADWPFGVFGTLLAVSYAAAIAGADWNWGVLRNVIARGESRMLYLLAKAVGLAIVLAVGVLVVCLVAFPLTYLASYMSGIPTGDPFSAGGLSTMSESLLLGYPVLLQRAALGFAVAVVLRSQLAGVVVGIVLYVAESIVAGVLTLAALGGRLAEGGLVEGFQPLETQWFQFLPFAIGDSVRAGGALGGAPETDIARFLLTPVELPLAVAVLVLYLAVALGTSLLAVQREEISA